MIKEKFEYAKKTADTFFVDHLSNDKDKIKVEFYHDLLGYYRLRVTITINEAEFTSYFNPDLDYEEFKEKLKFTIEKTYRKYYEKFEYILDEDEE